MRYLPVTSRELFSRRDGRILSSWREQGRIRGGGRETFAPRGESSMTRDTWAALARWRPQGREANGILVGKRRSRGSSAGYCKVNKGSAISHVVATEFWRIIRQGRARRRVKLNFRDKSRKGKVRGARYRGHGGSGRPGKKSTGKQSGGRQWPTHT